MLKLLLVFGIGSVIGGIIGAYVMHRLYLQMMADFLEEVRDNEKQKERIMESYSDHYRRRL